MQIFCKGKLTFSVKSIDGYASLSTISRMLSICFGCIKQHPPAKRCKNHKKWQIFIHPLPPFPPKTMLKYCCKVG